MTEKNVFVVGAGASAEAGLPTGETLKNKISKLLRVSNDFGKQNRSDITILAALEGHAKKHGLLFGNLINKANHISRALPLTISIDNFIDQHRDDKEIEICGKIAIVKSILEAERISKMYFEQTKSNKHLNFPSEGLNHRL